MNREQSAAHRFLSSYRVLARQAAAASEDYARVRSAAELTAAGAAPTGRPSGPSADRMAEAAGEMLAHAEAVASAAPRLRGLYEDRGRVIAAVAERNGLWGEVLQMFYAEGLSGYEIADWLGRDRAHPYAPSSVYRLRDRGLSAAFEEMRAAGIAAPE